MVELIRSIIINEAKANIIDITIVPANGRNGMVISNAIAITAPSEAPDDTPSVEPSARGFLRRPCIAHPQSERAAPTSAAHMTRGRRTDMIMDTYEGSDD